MNGHDDRSLALVAAEAGAGEWRAAVVAQGSAAPDHSEFYELAGHLVDTLRALDALCAVLGPQVAGYAAGRAVSDDEGGDPHARLRPAALHLAVARQHVGDAERATSEFWSAISHIGVRTTSGGTS